MSLQNASLLAQVQIARWLIENSPFKLQIARLFPFLGILGGSITYNRRNGGLNSAGTNVDCAPVADSSDTVAAATFILREFITRYKICFADQDRYQFPNDVDATEYTLALRRLLYGFFGFLDAAPGSGGLIDLIDPARIVDRGGAPLTLDCMDEAYQRVVSNDGRPTCIMASSRGLRTYHSITRAAGLDIPTVPFRWYNPAAKAFDECEVSAFNSTPILINDLMESFLSPLPPAQRIWFMVLGDDGEDSPTRGVTGIVPEQLKGRFFVKRENNGDPDFRAAEVRTAIDVWVSWPVGLALGSQGALSLIRNFAPVADCSNNPA